MPKVLDFRFRKQPDAEGHATHGAHHTPKQSGEVNAAIAMALSLYFSELHDQETAILTIKKAAKTYSRGIRKSIMSSTSKVRSDEEIYLHHNRQQIQRRH